MSSSTSGLGTFKPIMVQLVVCVPEELRDVGVIPCVVSSIVSKFVISELKMELRHLYCLLVVKKIDFKVVSDDSTSPVMVTQHKLPVLPSKLSLIYSKQYWSG